MQHLELHNVNVCIFVETSHGRDLEFVLDHAGDRTGNDYYDKLEEMLNAELGAYGHVNDVGAYGHVSCGIIVKHYDDIPQALELCNTAIAKWEARYNVKMMLDYLVR